MSSNGDEVQENQKIDPHVESLINAYKWSFKPLGGYVQPETSAIRRRADDMTNQWDQGGVAASVNGGESVANQLSQ